MRLRGALALALFLFAPALFAATITVNGLGDSLATDGVCTLREAVLNANNDAATYPDCAAGSGADVINLPAGERLGEHQVHERAWLLVVSGTIEIDGPGGDAASGGPGLLAEFDPNERREVRATEDARILLLLSPWPGEGHPSRHD